MMGPAVCEELLALQLHIVRADYLMLRMCPIKGTRRLCKSSPCVVSQQGLY